MKSLQKILTTSVLALTMVGCQNSNSPSPANTNDLNSSLSKLHCRESGTGASLEAAGIEGLESVKPGVMTPLQLGDEIDCDLAHNAAWSIGTRPIGHGSDVRAKINGSGIYFVQVEATPSPAVEAASASPTAQKALSVSTDSQMISSKVVVTNSDVLVVGPQAGTEGYPYTFSLAVPDGLQLTKAIWNFGDDSPTAASLGSLQHTFSAGSYNVTVTLTNSRNETSVISHMISVIPLLDGPFCDISQLEIVGPTELPVARRIEYSLNLTPCLKSLVKTAVWDFGDRTATVRALIAQHAYRDYGTYTIRVTAYFGSDTSSPSVILYRKVKVIDDMEEMPGPVDPVPTDPLACFEQGATRASDGATTTRTEACGLDGQRTNTYREAVVETCALTSTGLKWQETSRTLVLTQEGTCQGQSCQLTINGQPEILKNGESRVLYQSQTPAQTCSSVQETRVCTNGVVSGSSSAQFSVCHSGCGDFGAHGTLKLGVPTGEIQIEKSCRFQETGIYDLYQQVSDMRCSEGTVLTENTRQGDLKSAGQCPVYAFVATEQWSACSADCGGEQSRVFECRDQNGMKANEERCTASGAMAPLEKRACDGNPEAVSRTESSTTQEEAPASATCPKNQIGIILNVRDVTETKKYACIDHQVQLTSSDKTYGAWTSQTFCRDFTPARCSHDSLSNQAAQGRFAWMEKCKNEIPVVHEFLSKFNDVKYQKIRVDKGARRLYPTFMNADTKKPWIAPTSTKSSCATPAHIYVAAVCVSSCATPDQQILVQAREDRKLKYMPFMEALKQNMSAVATLHSSSSFSSKTVTTTKVDSWVTELLDTDHEILLFKMSSGGELKLTPNHPVLSQEGAMKLAESFQVGESLVRLGGQLDPILSIEKTRYSGKVYNVFARSNDLKRNVVVTNGYLNGTAFYQNEGAQFLNRALLREQLYRGAFEAKGNSK